MSDLPEFNGFMAGCPNAASDWAVVQNWFKYWKAQGEMHVYSIAYRNLMKNAPTLKSDY